MADINPTSTATEQTAATPAAGAASGSAADSQPLAAADSPMTAAQAEQVLAELKAIKQNLLWLLLLGGFFAARSFLFHY
ncbi:hypothetical protein PGN35_026920 [Nodosilinea sp. PGN35]|uniref:hypothetical protein n=1 Tax=Nodosilinea sp. PGN35 TaxID=3020489 RepID=UPI0023B32E3C|nr:hypothetical protein [Nodosilinea sp. TSF1-S3]MDF0365139.1 hypothetical protein [Nodosilinea sp. TSF1-S3]